MSKKIIFFIIVIQILFSKISYAQFTNPLESIFNEISERILNVTKPINESINNSSPQQNIGELKDYKVNEQGTVTTPDGKKYAGEFKNEKPNGQGTYTTPKGFKYVGELKDGKPNGQGTVTAPTGEMYVGEFKDGKPNGQGTETAPDGTKYVGEFKDGKPNGQGTATAPDGTKYVGEFKDGTRNGQGTLTLPTGTKYVGKFKDGKPIGQGTGTMTTPDGAKYVGEFKDGKPNGQGTATTPKGFIYVGEFKDGKPIGQGTVTAPTGEIYVGEFKDGKPNGQGTMTTPKGLKYVGELKDGKPNGQATVTTPDGAKYVGEFKDGEFNLHEKTKKVDKKEYKPQCDNPKMAELLKQNANSIKPLNDNSSNSSSANSFEQNTKFNQNFNQTYSRDPLLNKFFESYILYAQSTALLMEAYGKDQEAEIIRQSIIDSKNPNKGAQEKFSNSLTVVSEKSNNLKDLIYCRTEPLSAASKKKYEEAIPYAVKAFRTSFELGFMVTATAKNFKQAAKSDLLGVGLTALVYAMHAPQVLEYLSSIGGTFSFILTGAKANNIEGASQLQSTLKEL